MLKYIVANISFSNILETKESEIISNVFINTSINSVDFYFDENDNSASLTILGTKEQIISLILKGLKTQINFKEGKISVKSKVKSFSFYPLRMSEIKSLKKYIAEYLEEISSILQKGIIPLGHLANKQFPPHLGFYKELSDEKFQQYLKEDNSFISNGMQHVKSLKDIFYVIARPYPVVLYLKVALNEISVIETLIKKLKQFSKIKFNSLEKGVKNQKYSLLRIADIYNVTKDTVTMALKINDYVKIPVHKVMIYIYDILDKNKCIPYDAEFGFPVPSDVIKIASEVLFYDKSTHQELSDELKKVFKLFRFNNDVIFGYPSMLLEKKYNISDI